jgi:hypothetical protein
MKELKTENVKIRVRTAEREALKDWIDKNKSLKIRGRKVNESSLIRSLVRWFLGLDKPITDDGISSLRDMKNELSSIGGNLNQLTKAYNEGLIKTPINGDAFFTELLTLVNEIRKEQHLIVVHLEQGLTTKLSDVINE